MGGYSNLLSSVAQATYAVSGNGATLDLAEYRDGKIWVYTVGRTSAARLYPRFEESPDGARWLTMKSWATALKSTGLAHMTLGSVMKWSRISWTLAGTAAQVKFWASVAAKAGAY
jgi:hypothetical protein